MTTPETATRSVIVEREFAHPPAKIWRALTEGKLIEQWLLKNDFEPVAGHAFTLRQEPVPGWDGIIECKVLTVEPNKQLAYTWGTLGLGSMVTFTLTATPAGTHLRMEHSGFGPGQDTAFKGATYGWKNFMGRLERLIAELE